MASTDESVKRTSRILTAFLPRAVAEGFVIRAGPTVSRSMDRPGQQRRQADNDLCASEEKRCRSKGGLCMRFPILAQPVFPAIYGNNAEIKMIELGKVIACQWWVDTDVSDGVHGAGVVGMPDEDQILPDLFTAGLLTPARTLWQMPNRRLVTIYSTDATFDMMGTRSSIRQPARSRLRRVRCRSDAGARYNGRYVLANGSPSRLADAITRRGHGPRRDRSRNEERTYAGTVVFPTSELMGAKAATGGRLRDDTLAVNVGSVRAEGRASDDRIVTYPAASLTSGSEVASR